MIGSFDSVVLAAVAADLQPWIGSRVVRVTQPGAHEVAVELHASGRRSALRCSIHPQWASVYLAPPVPGGVRSPFAAMLHSRLARAELTALQHPAFERVLTLQFETDTGRSSLVAELMGRHSNLILVQDGIITGAFKRVPSTVSRVRPVLPGRPYHAPPATRPSPLELTVEMLGAILSGSTDPVARILSTRLLGIGPTMAREIAARAGLLPDLPAGGEATESLMEALRWLADLVERREFSPVVYLDGTTVLGYAPFPLQHVHGVTAEPAPTMSEAVSRVMAAQGVGIALLEVQASMASRIRAALAKVARTEAEVRRGLEEAHTAEVIKQHGDLLLAYASQIPAGASEATVPGYDGTPVTIPLDPTRTPVQTAQALFARYRRLRRAIPALEARLAALAQERAYLDSTLTMVDQAAIPGDLDDLAAELAAEGYLPRLPRRRRAPPERPRAFALPEGSTVLVGRTNADNDRITFKVAGPRDLWFHARGVPGAHVILRTGGRPPQPDEITRAAAIAAYFSRARDATVVAVDYTARAHVHKPKGSRPGFVVYERERTVQIRPQPP